MQKNYLPMRYITEYGAAQQILLGIKIEILTHISTCTCYSYVIQYTMNLFIRSLYLKPDSYAYGPPDLKIQFHSQLDL